MRLKFAQAVLHRIIPPFREESERPVIGIAIGSLRAGPITNAGPDDFCLVAYVPRLSVTTERRAREFFSGLLSRLDLPPRDVDIKIVEVGDLFRPLGFSGSDHGDVPSLNSKKWFSSLRPGIGICNPTVDNPTEAIPYGLCAGTVGFYVQEKNNEEKNYLVSCNHVIARSRIESDPRPFSAERIIQPASLDLSGHDIATCTNALDIETRFGVARLSDVVPLRPDDPMKYPAPSNLVDAATAIVDAPNRELALTRLPYSGRILGQASDFQVDPNTGTIQGPGQVYKVGRTTGYTEGYVAELGLFVPGIQYDGWTATFVDQMVIHRTPDNSSSYFCDEGDSGAALLTEDHKVAGLLFAGGPKVALASPISAVLAELHRVSGRVFVVI